MNSESVDKPHSGRLEKVAPTITETDIIDFARATAENAASLCEDSALLVESNSPRAFGLAILAAEELGKAWQCVAALIIRGWMMEGAVDLEGDPDELLALAVRTGTHSDKMTAMLALETVIPMLAGVEADALSGIFKRATGSEANELKKRSFYVDFVAGGAPSGPTDLLNDGSAIELREAICKSVVLWSILLPQMAERPPEEIDDGRNNPTSPV